jgi:hypothetical protein
MTDQPFYRVCVYRDADGCDCTNSGLSSKFTRAMLYRLPPDEIPHGYAGFLLNERMINGKKHLRAIPVGETRWVMFGGNFLWSCDSRFRQEVSEYPIPIHDRVES